MLISSLASPIPCRCRALSSDYKGFPTFVKQNALVVGSHSD